MTTRTSHLVDPIDEAMTTLSWIRREQVPIERIQRLVQQHPGVFGVGDSALTLAADYLDHLIQRRGHLTVIDAETNDAR